MKSFGRFFNYEVFHGVIDHIAVYWGISFDGSDSRYDEVQVDLTNGNIMYHTYPDNYHTN